MRRRTHALDPSSHRRRPRRPRPRGSRCPTRRRHRAAPIRQSYPRRPRRPSPIRPPLPWSLSLLARALQLLRARPPLLVSASAFRRRCHHPQSAHLSAPSRSRLPGRLLLFQLFPSKPRERLRRAQRLPSNRHGLYRQRRRWFHLPLRPSRPWPPMRSTRRASSRSALLRAHSRPSMQARESSPRRPPCRRRPPRHR
jgi:hypothetical protein